MALSRRDEVLKYSLLTKAGQELYKLILVNVMAESERYNWNFPFIAEWDSLIFVLFGEAVDKVTQLITKDEFYLRQMGGGSISKGLLKEIVSSVVAGVAVGVPTYFLLHFFATDLYDWTESDNSAKRGFANLLIDENAAKPVIGNAAYIWWRLSKVISMKLLDLCITPDIEHIVRYPNINFIQKIGREILNAGVGLAAYGMTKMVLDVTNTGLADNPHIAIGAAVTAYLANQAGVHACYERIEDNVPKEGLETIEIPGPNHPIDVLERYEAYRKPTNAEVAAATATYAIYNLILMGLATTLYETINGSDKSDKFNNPVKLIVVMSFVCTIDLFVREKKLITPCINAFFNKLKTQQANPVKEEELPILLKP